MTDDTRLSTILSGIAGEYFVAAELTRHGYIASITLRNTRGVDILATHVVTKKAMTIQVKTSQGAKKKWVLDASVETAASDNHFFVFVNLNGITDRPSFHIVASSVVSIYCREGHAAWLATPGRGGRPHGTSNVREFHDHENRYLDQWDLLSL
ncbi:MAG: hypothetical protein ABI670_15400 [Chloroflexota bacterium]